MLNFSEIISMMIFLTITVSQVETVKKDNVRVGVILDRSVQFVLVKKGGYQSSLFNVNHHVTEAPVQWMDWYKILHGDSECDLLFRVKQAEKLKSCSEAGLCGLWWVCDVVCDVVG